MLKNEQELRAALLELAGALNTGGEDWMAEQVEGAIHGSQEKFESFLVSNELWGGSGSIADQACCSDRTQRDGIETLLIKLGKLQVEVGMLNPRTASWVKAFEAMAVLRDLGGRPA
jgi:hypothetical protein